MSNTAPTLSKPAAIRRMRYAIQAIALLFVETGEAEAGIVYATDAATTGKATVAARFDASLTKPIRYPLVLLKTGSGNPGARQFVDYLCSPAAMKGFRAKGFLPLVEDPGGTSYRAPPPKNEFR